MNERIELYKNEIKELQDIHDLLEQKDKEWYDKKFEDLSSYGSAGLKKYDIKKKIDRLKDTLEIYELCNKENIDLFKKYYLTNNICLQFQTWASLRPTFYFYIENDSWFYENYISSHSGLNEWITNLIFNEYELYSDNSRYSHAFGCYDLEDMNRVIENKPNNDYDIKGNYKNDDIVKTIKGIVSFMEDEKHKDLRQTIIDSIEYKFNKMRELVKDE